MEFPRSQPYFTVCHGSFERPLTKITRNNFPLPKRSRDTVELKSHGWKYHHVLTGICSLLFGSHFSREWNKYLHHVPTLHHHQLPVLSFQCPEGVGRGGERTTVCSHKRQTTGSKSKSFSSECFAWVHTIRSLAAKQRWQPSLGMLPSLPGILFWTLALIILFFLTLPPSYHP